MFIDDSIFGGRKVRSIQGGWNLAILTGLNMFKPFCSLMSIKRLFSKRDSSTSLSKKRKDEEKSKGKHQLKINLFKSEL